MRLGELMIENTKVRVVTAFILMGLVVFAMGMGQGASILFVLLLGVLTVDEISNHFFSIKRKEWRYVVVQALFVVPFCFLNFYLKEIPFFEVATNLAMVLNLLLVVYLFYVKMESDVLRKYGDRYFFLIGLFVLIPLLAFSNLFYYLRWKEVILVLLFINFGMDSAAWFIGRRYGHVKLWTEVSPNKTVEGLLGGMLIAAIIGTMAWAFFLKQVSIGIFVFCFLLAGFSQVGDLIQSKLKRQFSMKDSGSLLPGHGGVYDRIDGLLFLAPFFAATIRYFYFD